MGDVVAVGSVVERRYSAGAVVVGDMTTNLAIADGVGGLGGDVLGSVAARDAGRGHGWLLVVCGVSSFASEWFVGLFRVGRENGREDGPNVAGDAVVG